MSRYPARLRRGRSPDSSGRSTPTRSESPKAKRPKLNALQIQHPSLSFAAGRPTAKGFGDDVLATHHYGQYVEMPSDYTTSQKMDILPLDIEMTGDAREATTAKGRVALLKRQLKILEIQKRKDDEAAARARDDVR